jgi:tetratricopeptide (TPR) repeat protein
MQKNNVNVLKFLAAMLFMLLTVNVSAQTTMKEVADAFNLGVQYSSASPELAIKSFEQAIKYADEVGGDEAMGLKASAIAQIPKLYFDWARGLAGKNDLTGSLVQLKNCIAASEKYNNTEYPPRAKATITNIYLALGNTARQGKKFDEAIANFDSAIEYDSKNVKAYLGKVLVYNEQEKINEMVEAAIGGMNSGPRPNDMPVLEDIKKVVSTSYFNSAQKTMQSKDYKATEENLQNAIKFGMDDNHIVYYQLGLARMSMEQWDNAVDALLEAAALDEGTAADKAKYYFNLGKSYEALGNTGKACESYKKALHGEFAQAAKFQIENVLKCGID